MDILQSQMNLNSVSTSTTLTYVEQQIVGRTNNFPVSSNNSEEPQDLSSSSTRNTEDVSLVSERGRIINQITSIFNNSLGSRDNGLVLETTHFRYESEKIEFSASGSVTMENGNSLNINLNLEMKRESITLEYVEQRILELLLDPLVIRLTNNPLKLSDERFSFDLDADGSKEFIPYLDSSSGYLAIDKNGDGVINDGGELFGPKSGNGFHDLEQYVTDEDGWIDSGDSEFDNFRVWVQTPEGNGKLLTLETAGVGAIFLGHNDTQFSIKSPENELLGEVKQLGVYLTTNGNSKAVYQIDLSTSQQERSTDPFSSNLSLFLSGVDEILNNNSRDTGLSLQIALHQHESEKIELSASGSVTMEEEAGVGAIFRGDNDTQISIKSSESELSEEDKKSGIYPTTNGGSKAVQQLDLTV